VSAEEIKTTCGLDDAYTVDFVYGELVAK